LLSARQFARTTVFLKRPNVYFICAEKSAEKNVKSACDFFEKTKVALVAELGPVCLTYQLLLIYEDNYTHRRYVQKSRLPWV